MDIRLRDMVPYGGEFMRSPSRGGFRLSLVVSAVPLMLVAAWLVPSAAQSPPSNDAGPAKSVRVPWTTSRVVGSPDPPPPFKVVRAFPNLKFEHPLLLARCPGSDRLFVGEQAGVLYSFRDRPDARADLFFDLRKELQSLRLLPQAKGVEAVYGLAFHPDFKQNRQCFVCYTLQYTVGVVSFHAQGCEQLGADRP